MEDDTPEGTAPGGAAFRAVAQRSRKTPGAIALAAIAVLAVAFLTKEAPPHATVDPSATAAPVATLVNPGVASQPAPAEAIEPSVGPTVALAPSPTFAVPTRNPTATPFSTFVAVPVAAGTIQLVPAGRTQVRLTIRLPDGWQKASDAMYVKSDGVAPVGLSIGAWQLEHVNTFPCRWTTQEFADPPFMRTAQGQAEALSLWWGQDPGFGPYGNARIAPLASKPDPTTFQGFSAWYVEVLIPSYLDHTECDAGQVVLWEATNGQVRYSLGPRELNHLWVVDVAGELVVIDAASFAALPSAETAELQAIVDSIVIEP